MSVASREYWPVGWKTTDGLFTLPAIKTVVFADANGEPVELRFANPAP